MNVIKMHNKTEDQRTKAIRILELKDSFLSFKESGEVSYAFNVLKNCLSLVNDVMAYSNPIKLCEFYQNYADSFIESSLDRKEGRFNYFNTFDYDHAEFYKWGQSNDLAPRFYGKQWFSRCLGKARNDIRGNRKEILFISRT
ncbi:hypothetical protein ACFSCX_06815 [Bacillus salitolerans]|uniref:Uncharacterized protein n=1 Tax=Bacillus salitolerans TaxID=1437434 RepID=A0ABW4LMG3_9BACI